MGREIAIRLAKEKCNIVIIDLNLIEAQKTALEIAEKFSVTTAAYKTDVSNYEAIQKLKTDIESTLGTVDILINNAGILSGLSLREGQPKDIQKVIDVNLTSHFWVRIDSNTVNQRSLKMFYSFILIVVGAKFLFVNLNNFSDCPHVPRHND